MNIGFDAKRAFLNRSGLGNYSRLVIQSLIKYHGENIYFLYTPSVHLKVYNPGESTNIKIRTPQNFHQRIFHSTWRSFGIAGELDKDKVSIYHGLSGEIPHNIHTYNIKSVVTIHDLIFLHYPELYKRIDRNIYEKKFRYACKNADKIIAISEQTKDDIVNFFKIDESRITVLYQSCQEIFHREVPASIQEQVKLKYQLPGEYILYVGTIEKRKNLLSVIKAMHSHRIDFPLVVVGRKTDYYSEIKSYISRHNIGLVHFPENVSNEDLPAIYQASALFVYPSVFEGFGIPIIEALFSGTPVITSKGSCFAEAGGPGSIFVEPENTEEIAVSVKKLLTDSVLRKQMVQSGYLHAQNFMPEKLTNQLIETYYSLAHAR